MGQPKPFETPRGAELAAALNDRMKHIRLAYAGTLEIVAEMHTTGVAAEVGYSSLAAFLVDATNMSRQKANRMVAQATQVAETVTPTGHVRPAVLPNVRDALRDGFIDGEHVDVIVKVMEQLPPETSVDNRELVESTLAFTARSSEPRVVKNHGEILLSRLNQDGVEPADEVVEPAPNSFRYQRLRDGGMKYAGRLDQAASEELLALLGPLAKPQPQEHRSEDQRNGDALADIIHIALTGGAVPDHGGEKPHLNLIVNPHTGTATADGGSTFSASAVRQQGCDPNIIPIKLDDMDQPLNVGRKQRLVSTRQQRALIVRDKGCAFPGCHLPPRWTDAHHIIHWKDGGPTDLANLVLLCRRHHTLLHKSPWQIDVLNGLPHFKPPRWVDPEQRLRRNVLRQ